MTNVMDSHGDSFLCARRKQRPHTSASRKNTRNKQNVQTIDAQTHVAKKTSKKQERRRCRNENDVEAFHHHKQRPIHRQEQGWA